MKLIVVVSNLRQDGLLLHQLTLVEETPARTIDPEVGPWISIWTGRLDHTGRTVFMIS